MKNLLFSAVIFLALSLSAAAAPAEPVNEKVQKTFSMLFKDADDIRWSSRGNLFEAFFIIDGVQSRATIDSKGNLIQTIRYYSEDLLPANVLFNIKKTYKSKEIFGVTEVSNHLGVNYRIILKDDKHYTHINANNQGESEIVAKYKRGDK
ncbi:hypothetical protein ABDK00_000420 [Niabella insulamsoli]|uniref:hypothetical protein n=1 Tax=Niabella insulamsoli TaxID=3144874 RepID=UPI0031FCDE6C